MELRIHASTEVPKGCLMSKAPDLSAFPIPRKGAARPIEVAETAPAAEDVERAGEGAQDPARTPEPALPDPGSVHHQVPPPASAPQVSTGRLLATTLKLDGDRYLRLQEAAKPNPGRLRRRTTQEILTEALDEWLTKRGL